VQEDGHGGGALWYAVKNLKEDVIKLLLGKGAIPLCNYESVDDEGRLLLKKCVKVQNGSMVRKQTSL
jgi:hypothetical protein